MQIPGGVPGGGMVTPGIDSCITPKTAPMAARAYLTTSSACTAGHRSGYLYFLKSNFPQDFPRGPGINNHHGRITCDTPAEFQLKILVSPEDFQLSSAGPRGGGYGME